MSLSRNRRSFLERLTGLVGGVAIVSRSAEVRAFTPQAPAPHTWDTGWLSGLNGKHKQVYDLIWHTPRSNTLSPPMNYFDAHKEMSGLEFPDINVVIGINSTAYPINATDAMWAKFKLGERYAIKDPRNGQPATRNVYLGSADERGSTVKTLQAKGAVFLMCNNSLQAIASDWSREMGRPASELHAELIAGLNPNVKVVPALTWAVGTLQERGFTYERL
jgi:intracellular sulfur oxidation DsrE/DsrF family protein